MLLLFSDCRTVYCRMLPAVSHKSIEKHPEKTGVFQVSFCLTSAVNVIREVKCSIKQHSTCLSAVDPQQW